jgi:hypothetical protein
MALFIHNKNQELLWNVINKTQIFQLVFAYSRNNEPELWFRAHIQQYYQKIQNKILSVEDLNSCNHEMVAIMMNNLKSFSENNGNAVLQQNHQPPQQMVQQLPHTVENKQELYSRQFNERQKEYELMNTKPTPPVPDINNNIKDEAISNMDELIKLHMQQREAEMKQFAPQPITQTPLENSFKTNNNIKITSTNENITLMPDVVLNETDKPRKNVSWSDNNESEKIYKELHNEMNDLKTQVLNIANSFHSFQEEMRIFMNIFSNKQQVVDNVNNVENNKDFVI